MRVRRARTLDAAEEEYFDDGQHAADKVQVEDGEGLEVAVREEVVDCVSLAFIPPFTLPPLFSLLSALSEEERNVPSICLTGTTILHHTNTTTWGKDMAAV